MISVQTCIKGDCNKPINNSFAGLCLEHLTDRNNQTRIAKAWWLKYRERYCYTCGESESNDNKLVVLGSDDLMCQTCIDNCEHEFDADSGFMCLHCDTEGLEYMGGYEYD